MPGGERLAKFGIDGARPPKWVPELAEELARMIEGGTDPGTISRRIREAARAQGIPDQWFVTQLVAHEWDRLGLARIPKTIAAGGW